MNAISYADSFDHATVRQCRDYEEMFRGMAREVPVDDPERDGKIDAIQRFRNVCIWHTTGERAEAKITYVRDMENRDERRERLLERTVPRTDISCGKCFFRMEFLMKELFTSIDDRDRVLIMYECPNKCLPRRAFYDNGEEFVSKDPSCVKCGKPVIRSTDGSSGHLIVISTCNACGHVESEDFDVPIGATEDDVVDENYERDRAEYCLDEKGLDAYREGKRNLDGLRRLVDEWKSREADTPTNERMASLRKLRAIELKELATKALEQVGMTSVTLSDPVQGTGLRIKVSMLDSDPKRADKESERAVRNALEQALLDTNWRLVKTSLVSTLGAVTGELRGYVSDEEIRKLIEQENKANESRKSP
ncbi:MAG: hypothetical protein WCT54_00440 [Patescibacteria group bacterium]|jgi:transcription elongation factor Elf1